MKIITFASEKGGVGKSTLSIHMATYLNSLGKKVVIMDCDPQESIYQYKELIKDSNIDIEKTDQEKEKFKEQISKLEKYDIIFFDTAGKLNSYTNKVAVEVCDILITPTSLSLMDINSTKKYYNLIKSKYPDKYHIVVMNKTKAVKELREYRDLMRENNIKCFATSIPDKRSFVRKIDLKNRIDEDSFDALIMEVENLL